MQNTIKNSLFVFLFAVLLLPMLQQHFALINLKPLFGFSEDKKYQGISRKRWFNGEYRENTTKYFNDNIGFRQVMIRLNNQLEYSMFDKLNAPWVAPGKEHYMFQTLHLAAYYGNDYAGYEKIKEKLLKVKALQDTLAKLNKTMIIVYAPTKSFLYPEFIEDIYKVDQHTTNSSIFPALGDSLNINQIDFNAWFVAIRDKSPEKLFTKQGIHWSVYGSLLAADSFVFYVERIRHIHMLHPKWIKILHTTIARNSDDDLEKTTNLLYPRTKEIFSYPVVYYASLATTVSKPRIMYIGDSFLQNWVFDELMQQTDSDWHVFDHFTNIQDKDHIAEKQEYPVDGNNWIKAMNDADCIVVMGTGFNLPYLGDGFIEQAYDHFYPGH